MNFKSTLIAVALSLSAGLAQAQTTYDLPQLEALALETSRAVAAGRDRVTAARYAVDSAAAFPNPELEYLGGTARSRAPGGTAGDARSLSLTQPLDMPWRRYSRIAAAEAGLESATAGYQVFEADALARLRMRYYEVLRRVAEYENAKQDLKLMEDVRSRIALRVETGDAARFELIKADSEMMGAQKNAQAAGFRVEQSRSQLRQSVGGGMSTNFLLTGSLKDVPAIPDLASLRQQLRTSSPDLAIARAETVRAERQLEFERAQRWPNLALKAGVDEDPDLRTSKIGLVVSIPLWDRRKGPVGEATAQLARARNELEAQTFGLGQSLEVASQQYEIAQAQVVALESGIVKKAESALNVAEAAYRFGERGFLEVLDAQRVYRAVRLELIVARFELASAWVEIERLRATRGENK
jgi:cobalt-zinc-cadmium efflux system outer membrane protein